MDEQATIWFLLGQAHMKQLLVPSIVPEGILKDIIH